MTPQDFAGVFSRFFIIGFFLPSFFVLVAMDQLAPLEVGPTVYTEASAATQLLILGGVGLLLALLLSGLHYLVLRLFEGYPLRSRQAWPLLGRLHRVLVGRWEKKFDQLTEQSESTESEVRTSAIKELDRYYPAERESILPTRLGNSIAAFESHPRKRYGLAGVASWARISLLLSDGEREEVVDAQTNLALFVNAALLAFLGTVVIGALEPVDGGSFCSVFFSVALKAIIGGVACFAFYVWAIDAVLGWGSVVRAAFDLHRLELYEQLGLRQPTGIGDEKALARAVNRCFLFAEPFPNAFRAKDKKSKEDA